MTELPPIMAFEQFEALAKTIMLPGPGVSKFGAKTWAQTFEPAEQYNWLIKDIVPDREAVLVYGASQTGKSFEVQRLAMHVAMGQNYNGRRVRKAGVVYCACEGGKGFLKRQRAYAKAHSLDANSAIDIVVLTKRVDLFSSDSDINDLIVEIKNYATTFSEPLGLVILDTWSAATPGANENASEDVSKVRQRVMRVVEQCACSVIVVHHKPAAGGRPRGHGSLTADFETTIDIDWDGGDKEKAPLDRNSRRIRKAKLDKQREGEANVSWKFVLRQIEIGVDQEGDPITSCVSEAPDYEREVENKASATDNRLRLNHNERIIFDAFVAALNKNGRKPPADIAEFRDKGIEAVTTLTAWREELEPLIAEENEDPQKLSERARKSIQRAYAKFQGSLFGLIVKKGMLVGRTDRKVFGVDRRDLPYSVSGTATAEFSSPLMTAEDQEEGLPF